MIIYTVQTTEKTKGYTPCVFAETLSGIYVEAPGDGFFKHPSLKTPADLKAHLDQLRKEGFKIRKATHTV